LVEEMELLFPGGEAEPTILPLLPLPPL